MALTEEQKIAASEWLIEHPKIQKQFREITYDLIYRPLLQLGAAALAVSIFGFVWLALWWKILLTAPAWWQDVFIFTLTFSVIAFLNAIMAPSHRARLTIVGAILLIIPYAAGLTANVLS